MDTLKRYRSGGEQKVTVTHVSVCEGGQAIVGNINQGNPQTAADKVKRKMPALTNSPQQAMPIIDNPEPVHATVRRQKRDRQSST
jgi:hypothetical protein